MKKPTQLRTLIDVMPAYVGTSFPDGTVDLLSQSWLDYFGQTREEAMGWGWTGVLHPDDVDRILANWNRLLVGRRRVLPNYVQRCRQVHLLSEQLWPSQASP
jgi:PAS domain S-box-containing protein